MPQANPDSDISAFLSCANASGHFLNMVGRCLGQDWYQFDESASQGTSPQSFPSVGKQCGLVVSFPPPRRKTPHVTSVLRNFIFALNIFSMLSAERCGTSSSVDSPPPPHRLCVYVPSNHSSFGHLMASVDELRVCVDAFTRAFLTDVCQIDTSNVSTLMTHSVTYTSDLKEKSANVAVCYGGPVVSGGAGLHNKMEWQSNNNGFTLHHDNIRTLYLMRPSKAIPNVSTHGSFAC